MIKVRITLNYQGNTYSFVPEDCEYDEISKAHFMWEQGNFSCDCNKSLFIQRQCDENFPELECGEEVTLISIEEDTP